MNNNNDKINDKIKNASATKIQNKWKQKAPYVLIKQSKEELLKLLQSDRYFGGLMNNVKCNNDKTEEVLFHLVSNNEGDKYFTQELNKFFKDNYGFVIEDLKNMTPMSVDRHIDNYAILRVMLSIISSIKQHYNISTNEDIKKLGITLTANESDAKGINPIKKFTITPKNKEPFSIFCKFDTALFDKNIHPVKESDAALNYMLHQADISDELIKKQRDKSIIFHTPIITSINVHDDIVYKKNNNWIINIPDHIGTERHVTHSSIDSINLGYNLARNIVNNYCDNDFSRLPNILVYDNMIANMDAMCSDKLNRHRLRAICQKYIPKFDQMDPLFQLLCLDDVNIASVMYKIQNRGEDAVKQRIKEECSTVNKIYVPLSFSERRKEIMNAFIDSVKYYHGQILKELYYLCQQLQKETEQSKQEKDNSTKINKIIEQFNTVFPKLWNIQLITDIIIAQKKSPTLDANKVHKITFIQTLLNKVLLSRPNFELLEDNNNIDSLSEEGTSGQFVYKAIILGLKMNRIEKDDILSFGKSIRKLFSLNEKESLNDKNMLVNFTFNHIQTNHNKKISVNFGCNGDSKVKEQFYPDRLKMKDKVKNLYSIIEQKYPEYISNFNKDQINDLKNINLYKDGFGKYLFNKLDLNIEYIENDSNTFELKINNTIINKNNIVSCIQGESKIINKYCFPETLKVSTILRNNKNYADLMNLLYKEHGESAIEKIFKPLEEAEFKHIKDGKYRLYLKSKYMGSESCLYEFNRYNPYVIKMYGDSRMDSNCHAVAHLLNDLSEVENFISNNPKYRVYDWEMIEKVNSRLEKLKSIIDKNNFSLYDLLSSYEKEFLFSHLGKDNEQDKKDAKNILSKLKFISDQESPNTYVAKLDDKNQIVCNVDKDNIYISFNGFKTNIGSVVTHENHNILCDIMNQLLKIEKEKNKDINYDYLAQNQNHRVQLSNNKLKDKKQQHNKDDNIKNQNINSQHNVDNINNKCQRKLEDSLTGDRFIDYLQALPLCHTLAKNTNGEMSVYDVAKTLKNIINFFFTKPQYEDWRKNNKDMVSQYNELKDLIDIPKEIKDIVVRKDSKTVEYKEDLIKKYIDRKCPKLKNFILYSLSLVSSCFIENNIGNRKELEMETKPILGGNRTNSFWKSVTLQELNELRGNMQLTAPFYCDYALKETFHKAYLTKVEQNKSKIKIQPGIIKKPIIKPGISGGRWW